MYSVHREPREASSRDVNTVGCRLVVRATPPGASHPGASHTGAGCATTSSAAAAISIIVCCAGRRQLLLHAAGKADAREAVGKDLVIRDVLALDIKAKKNELARSTAGRSVTSEADWSARGGAQAHDAACAGLPQVGGSARLCGGVLAALSAVSTAAVEMGIVIAVIDSGAEEEPDRLVERIQQVQRALCPPTSAGRWLLASRVAQELELAGLARMYPPKKLIRRPLPIVSAHTPESQALWCEAARVLQQRGPHLIG